MGKYALLVGVTEYNEPTLKPLPGAVRDVREIKKILQDPNIGDFLEENIKLLENPDRNEIEESIYELFVNRKQDDLVLFYFAGHGIIDKQGQFYLANRCTIKDGNKVRDYTAVSAKYLQEKMTQSLSEQQVVILDCCFSGAFSKGMTARGTVNIETQLGGKGRAVLASSTSTQYSFEHKESGFGIYTHYVLEGLQNGVADYDSDGNISVGELHDYVISKVKKYCIEQDIDPPMTPEIYAIREGYKICLSKAPKIEIINLVSEVGIDYTSLKTFLQSAHWEEANRETTEIFFKLINYSDKNSIDDTAIRRVPCSDLRTIDYLWTKFSNGRFGFSVQRHIWESVGGSSNTDWTVYRSFLRQVGWINNYSTDVVHNWIKKFPREMEDFSPPTGFLPECGFNQLWIKDFKFMENHQLNVGDYVKIMKMYVPYLPDLARWMVTHKTIDEEKGEKITMQQLEFIIQKRWEIFGNYFVAFSQQLKICKISNLD